MPQDITPINEKSSNSTIVTIVNQLITNLNKMSNLIGQAQSSYDRNNEELMEVKRMVTDFIIKRNDLPLKNEKEVKELSEKIQDISDRLIIVENSLKQTTESFTPMQETVSTLADNMEVIFDFKKDYEQSQQKVINNRRAIWGKVWELAKPVLIILFSGAIILLFIKLGNVFIAIGEFLSRNLLR